MGTNSATPFLWGAGTSNNGLLVSALQVLSTEANALAAAAVAVSSVGGASGVFTNSNTGQAVFGDVVFFAGGAFTPTAAASMLSGWFLKSLDGGSTFEFATAAPTRPADFFIPLVASAYSTNQQAWSIGTHAVRIPAVQFKVMLLNSSVTLPATGNLLKLVLPALDY